MHKQINTGLPASLKYVALAALLYCLTVCCNSNRDVPLTPAQLPAVHDSAGVLMDSIAKDVSHYGPVAWLKYFENTPAFFMADDGKLVFPNNDSAANFINNILVKNISKIKLYWDNVRIDPLTTSLAGIAAGYHEDITDFSAITKPYDGYFTAIAEKTIKGWQLRNAHWSLAASK